MPPPVCPLQRARLSAFYTQKELASLTGVTRYVIADLERTRRMPSLKLARKLSAALETPIDVLFPPTETEVHA